MATHGEKHARQGAAENASIHSSPKSDKPAHTGLIAPDAGLGLLDLDGARIDTVVAGFAEIQSDFRSRPEFLQIQLQTGSYAMVRSVGSHSAVTRQSARPKEPCRQALYFQWENSRSAPFSYP